MTTTERESFFDQLTIHTFEDCLEGMINNSTDEEMDRFLSIGNKSSRFLHSSINELVFSIELDVVLENESILLYDKMNLIKTLPAQALEFWEMKEHPEFKFISESRRWFYFKDMSTINEFVFLLLGQK